MENQSEMLWKSAYVFLQLAVIWPSNISYSFSVFKLDVKDKIRIGPFFQFVVLLGTKTGLESWSVQGMETRLFFSIYQDIKTYSSSNYFC